MALTHKNLLSGQTLQTWLQDDNLDVRVLDASFSMPGSLPSAYDIYMTKRIKGAQYFDIDVAADDTSALPHMLPTSAIFEEYASSLGISCDTHVVIYGQDNIAMGPARALWMFDLFGHKNVYLLNESFKYWEASGKEIEHDPPSKIQKSTYKVKNTSAERCVTHKDILHHLDNKSALIIDARPQERFDGHVSEPRQGLRSGHIPQSHNMPTHRLINPKTGGLIDMDHLKTMLGPFLNSDKAVITTCGSGVTACVVQLGLDLLDCQNVSVYDGSWSQWGQEELGTPISKTSK